jgi:hypothetical protein
MKEVGFFIFVILMFHRFPMIFVCFIARKKLLNSFGLDVKSVNS